MFPPSGPAVRAIRARRTDVRVLMVIGSQKPDGGGSPEGNGSVEGAPDVTSFATGCSGVDVRHANSSVAGSGLGEHGGHEGNDRRRGAP